MATVVLLRGANLGKRRFSPLALADALRDLDATSVGAAGTFVVRGRVAAATLRERVQAELPWEDAEMAIVPGAEVRAALDAGAKLRVPEGAKKFGAALDKQVKGLRLPHEVAGKGGAWAIRCEVLAGRVLIGARRRVDESGAYTLDALEREHGVRATIRDWPTWERVGAQLAASGRAQRTKL